MVSANPAVATVSPVKALEQVTVIMVDASQVSSIQTNSQLVTNASEDASCAGQTQDNA
jgi:hypothetical protein